LNWILDKNSSKVSSFRTLTNDLVSIFSLHKEVVIYLVKNWVHKFYPQKDLTDYYNYSGGMVYTSYQPVINVETNDFIPSELLSSRYSISDINLDNHGTIQIVR